MIFPYESKSRNNRVRGEEKKKIVLLWIAQFDFCSIELLSFLLRQYPDQTNLFFRKLIADGYLVRFKSANLPRNDLVRIGFEGVAYLMANFGIDVKRKMRSDELARKKKLYHDYCLQLYIASHFMYGDKYSVITEKNISRANGKAHRIMDALIFDRPNEHKTWNVSAPIPVPEEISYKRSELNETFDDRGFWSNPDAPMAIEIELTPKSKTDLNPIFINLLWQIYEGKLQHVRFVFDNAQVRDLYKRRFDELKMQHSKLPATSRYRNCFNFEVDLFFPHWLLGQLEDDPRDWDLAHP